VKVKTVGGPVVPRSKTPRTSNLLVERSTVVGIQWHPDCAITKCADSGKKCSAFFAAGRFPKSSQLICGTSADRRRAVSRCLFAARPKEKQYAEHID